MKHNKKWTLIYAIGWLVIGIALVAVSVYQWITLEQAIVSVGYAIGGGCCIVPAIFMFLKWYREEEIELEAYGRQFDEEVAKRQGQLRIDLNAEKEELKQELELYKQSNRVLNNELDKATEHIGELEEKLSEMTEKYNACQEARKLENEFSQQDKKELKQQLAEKDVEIEDLRKMRERFLKLKEQKPNEFELLNLRDDVEGLLKELAEKEKEIESKNSSIKWLEENYNKERHRANEVADTARKHNYDMAIQKLEEVKELCKKKFDWWENSEYEGDIYDKSDVSNAYFDIEANIDEQIEQLIYLKRSVEECNKITELEFELQHKDQDKISFCIERLEKVKEFVDNLDTPCVESICNEYMCDIEDYIDNQIKELREKEDE